MNLKIIIILIMSAIFSFSASSVQAKKEELPQVTVDGLHLVPDAKLAIVYAEPGADLAPYKRVQLLPAYVAFKKNWARNQRSSSSLSGKVRPEDMERIKNSLSEEFYEVFKNSLTEAGYEITDEVAADVMIVRPAIINLNVTAPDLRAAGRMTTYVSSAGEMTLYIELWDSVSGDIMAKALDRRADNSFAHSYTWANPVSNRAAAVRILKGWAEILVNALNEAKTHSPDTQDGS